MCLFKKKKKPEPIVGNKFDINDHVGFHNGNDLVTGYIYAFKKDDMGNIIYDVQVGGECPYVKKDIQENKLHLR